MSGNVDIDAYGDIVGVRYIVIGDIGLPINRHTFRIMHRSRPSHIHASIGTAALNHEHLTVLLYDSRNRAVRPPGNAAIVLHGERRLARAMENVPLSVRPSWVFVPETAAGDGNRTKQEQLVT
ncbi:hypothetical protein EVAR_22291_1 [Eumeta japonica]|uniref:Uncharacterized protein n=1 Tax=Eumeta variegata TaxID=151549 RepID=A0A4C1UBW5_EUMVA|nr:hypothetical protein EVAR_22291_1 [Eumeta japonica]